MGTQAFEQDELNSWLRLLLTPGIGSQAARKLLAAFGSAAAIFEQNNVALAQVLTQKQVQAIQTQPSGFLDAWSQLGQWLDASPTHHIIPLGHPYYPQTLYEAPDPPILFFASGDLTLLKNPALAIVGSRNPTAQGKETTADFSQTLSRSGLTVVSGMASGIDGVAQQCALKEQGKTIAVLGTGIDRVYPAQHHGLAHKIAQQGLLLSEFPLGTPPISTHFPKRNRIIAGLSLGTLVVEATLHSGSLITAKLATDMGREVFAIPGSIHSPQSKGCHWLIRQGAKLVESAQDILEELHLPLTLEEKKEAPQKRTMPASAQGKNTPSDNPCIDKILQAIGEGPTGLDAIAARSGLDAATLQSGLLHLELENQIARLPGGLFQRLHSR